MMKLTTTKTPTVPHPRKARAVQHRANAAVAVVARVVGVAKVVVVRALRRRHER